MVFALHVHRASTTKMMATSARVAVFQLLTVQLATCTLVNAKLAKINIRLEMMDVLSATEQSNLMVLALIAQLETTTI